MRSGNVHREADFIDFDTLFPGNRFNHIFQHIVILIGTVAPEYRPYGIIAFSWAILGVEPINRDA